MKIHNPEFVCSAVIEKNYPKHQLKEIALVGRSNVGKSSLINKLINRKKLARTSSQPGRTQTINFYKMDDYFYFVDLPGYGFAKVPLEVKKKWGEMIEHYLYNRSNLSAVIQLVDARHKPTEDDQMMYNWLKEMKIPALVVATKADKVSRGKRKPAKDLIFKTLNLPENQPFTFFSAQTGEGKDEVWKFIKEYI
ncbi:YihA family ribosome biogenesis GTP-binding protein [Anoxybacter fermentans]|uniref:Probable GTP-binding protein EngB n=1 Tax=Anoxybacter fermentans TaxID=1323375 RepID=A0A3Q9HQJ9_9FIRM|nr:ribosome biogenesis GTP-binding protein YihA/YsxC [Anoxybacter fermentans]AZR73376.1 YihA family ribosome biogenesis GTP-binding protein [Anoxybacter fermentans]